MRTWIAALLLSLLPLTPAMAGAQSPIVVAGATPSPSPSSADAVQAKIATLAGEIEALAAEGALLTGTLQELKDSKPQHPGANATSQQIASHQKALAAWKKKVEQLHKKLAKTQDALNAKQNELEKLQSKLTKAQAKDLEKVRKQLEAAKAALANTRHSASKLSK